MKKILLIGVVLFMVNISLAQDRVVLPDYLKDVAVKTVYVKPNDVITNPFLQPPNQTVNAKGIAYDETIIGRTYYDLQSNKLLQNRFHLYEDGTMGAVWTRGMETPNFGDRGTGYNFFDGSSWGAEPAERLESLRTGWPSYAPWGANGEVVVSHDFGAHVLYFLTRPDKGTGTWTESAFSYTSGPPELSWARMMTSGENNNTIHLLANSFNEYEGQISATVYSLSTDGGASWDVENIMLDGMGSDYYTEISADEYVFAEPVGETIAFLVAGAWHDMFMMKSTDNGENWEKTVIWEHPYPFFDWEVTITDTFFCVDNSASIALDNDGKAHVVFGINRVLHEEAGTSYFLFPYIDGIGYWNEDMPTFSDDLSALAPPQLGYPGSEMIEDVNYIGWTQDVNGNGEIDFVDDIMWYRELGVSTMPTIAIDASNQLYVTWASTTETYDNFDFNFKKIWLRAYGNGSWGQFVHITEPIVHIFDETVYPIIAVNQSDIVHIIYNADGVPGLALDEDHDYVENRVIHYTDLIVEIEENLLSVPGLSIESLYPNPASDDIRLTVHLQEVEELELKITDVTGRIVIHKDIPGMKAGSHSIKVNISHIPAGIYYCTLTDGTQKSTKTLLKTNQ